MLGSFSYSTRSFHSEKAGILIRGRSEFIVKYEDIPQVLGSSSYRNGLIVLLSYFKKVDKEGGYDLVEVPVTEFPAEFPSSLNDEQLVSFLKEIKKNRRKNFSYVIRYFKDNEIESYFFANRVRNILNDLNVPHRTMLEFNELCEKIHNADLKRIIVHEDESLERGRVIKRAGL
jgi:hypothetical protein